MTQRPDTSPASSSQSIEESWNADAERRYDNGEINADEARLASGLLPAGHEAGEMATSHTTQLELVTEDHEPLPGAKREPKRRKPRPARTAREKRAADQPPAHQRVTSFGHDPILTAHKGGKS